MAFQRFGGFQRRRGLPGKGDDQDAVSREPAQGLAPERDPGAAGLQVLARRQPAAGSARDGAAPLPLPVWRTRRPGRSRTGRPPRPAPPSIPSGRASCDASPRRQRDPLDLLGKVPQIGEAGAVRAVGEEVEPPENVAKMAQITPRCPRQEAHGWSSPAPPGLRRPSGPATTRRRARRHGSAPRRGSAPARHARPRHPNLPAGGHG